MMDPNDRMIDPAAGPRDVNGAPPSGAAQGRAGGLTRSAPRLHAGGPQAPLDGRQSQAALDIARGTARLLHRMGASALSEFTLSNGRRADLIAVHHRGEISIIEIKSCRQDFLTDGKWPEYRPFCDRFYFAVDSDFPRELIPGEAGLICADRFDAEVLREAPREKMAGARRSALLRDIARHACQRLQRINDPEFGAD